MAVVNEARGPGIIQLAISYGKSFHFTDGKLHPLALAKKLTVE